MIEYDIEYYKNIIFFRLKGILNINNINMVNDELDILINKLGINNIVFNLEKLNYIDIYSIDILSKWNKLIKSRKGVSFICGVNGYSRYHLLNNMKEIRDEICAIKMINWMI